MYTCQKLGLYVVSVLHNQWICYFEACSLFSTEKTLFAKYPIKPATKVNLSGQTVIWEDIERGKLTIKCSKEHFPHETDTIIKEVFDYIQLLILKACI